MIDAAATRSYQHLSNGKIGLGQALKFLAAQSCRSAVRDQVKNLSNRKRGRLMNTIIQIVRHTPIWVFPLFAAVLWLGSINLRERTMPLRLLFVLPIVMLVLSIGNTIGTCAEPLFVLIDWLLAAAVGVIIGWKLTQKPLTIDPNARRMTLPPSVVPLMVCVAIIVLRYAFGYLYGRYPELLADRNYALALIAGGTLLGGVMFGRCARLGQCYWQASARAAAA
jgi:hypothetical protein